jgi:hypothetical protein
MVENKEEMQDGDSKKLGPAVTEHYKLDQDHHRAPPETIVESDG